MGSIPTVPTTHMSKILPIRPQEVITKQIESIPDEVMLSFNELIAEKFSNGRAVVKQDDVIARILGKMETSRDEIFKNHWLDVEKIYRKAGWKVDYDKPGYNETYDAYFEFVLPVYR